MSYHVEQLYTGCLAQGAYYIVSNGEAALIDPLREPQTYLERLKKDGVKLKYIFETHFHADFVSGHVELSKLTGAKVIYGPQAECGFDCISAQDGERFRIGNVQLEVLHTPGHTMESSCFLLRDETDKPVAVFTGDTLFIGDVGRPDLAQKAAKMTQEQLAALLFHSLRNKLMTLPDEVIVYPGHGAGSACGKNMSKETVSTIGEQKRTNYALRETMTEQEFIKEVLDGLTPPPAYFGYNVLMNKQGYEETSKTYSKALTPLSVEKFQEIMETVKPIILDTRDAAIFAKGFIPGSINIGINGDFAPWAGTILIDVNQPIVFIAEPGKEEEVVIRLSRVGFDNIHGYLAGGFASWLQASKSVDTINRITANQFAELYTSQKTAVIDVRKQTEYDSEHVQEAQNLPLAYIHEWHQNLDREKTWVLHCAGGYRSMIAASFLKNKGFQNLIEVEGGFNAITQTNVPKTDFVCQNTIKK